MAKFKLNLETVLDALDRHGPKATCGDIKRLIPFNVADRTGHRLNEMCTAGYAKKIKIKSKIKRNLYTITPKGKNHLEENRDKIQTELPETDEEVVESGFTTDVQSAVNGFSKLVVVHEKYVKYLRKLIKNAQNELIQLGEQI